MKKLRTHYACGGAATLLLLGGSAVSMAQSQAPAGAASLGTLEYGADVYYPQGCQHNGSTVVCTFVFVHQTETQTILAGGGGSQLTGIQFVDDGHVPHNPNNAYFVDRYGARQHVLTVNRSDQGTMMVEFPLVDTRVEHGEFHLGTQVLAGIPVGQGGAGAAPGTPNALTAGGGGQGATPGAPAGNTQQADAATANGCNTPQLANTSGCKLNAKIHQAEVSTANTATSVTAPVNAVSDAAKQLGALFSGFTPKKPATTPATPAQQPSATPSQ
jgi:hypothetical protein